MAKVGASIYTPNLAGRQASTVFSSNKYGQYMKPFKAPSQPRTTKTMIKRAAFTLIAKLWATLTLVQILAWNNIAKTGETGTFKTKNGVKVSLTGFGVFLMHNLILKLIGEPVITNCPHAFISPVLDISDGNIDAVATPGNEDLLYNFTGAIAAGERIILKGIGFIKNGTQPKWGRERILAVLDDTFTSGDSIKDEWIAVFGSLPEAGEQVGVTAETVNKLDGTTGIKSYMTAVATI